MNTTNILLATTSILILVAFGLSLKGFSDDRDDPDNREEFAQLKKEMEELEAERRAFELSQLRAAAPPVSPVSDPEPIIDDEPLEAITPGSATTELDESERSALEERIAELENGIQQQEEETEEEALYKKREKMISMALDMGTVLSASKEHATVIYEPSRNSPNHQPGTMLAVRRKSGIIGEIEVDRLDASGKYVATMRPQDFTEDGYPDIRPGDTIIIDPTK